jgi:hypothetical protein
VKLYPDSSDAASDIQSQGSVAQFPGGLEDQVLFNLDFMDDLAWNSGPGEVQNLGARAT